MGKHGRPGRIARWLLGGLATMGVLGGDCDGISIEFPGGAIWLKTVTVELTNLTDYPVDPWIYVDDHEDVFFDFQMVTSENFVYVDPPVQPGETVTLRFGCDEIGTIKSHYAEMLTPFDTVESDNDPFLREEDDFECGDTIHFIFVPRGGGLYTDVEVDEGFL